MARHLKRLERRSLAAFAGAVVAGLPTILVTSGSPKWVALSIPVGGALAAFLPDWGKVEPGHEPGPGAAVFSDQRADSITALLDPRRRLVPFLGRESELGGSGRGCGSC